MTPDILRTVCAFVMVAGLLSFVDLPARTLGQNFLLHRWRDRLLLLIIEADLLIVWAAGRLLFGWDRPLVPPERETLLAVAGAAFVVLGTALAVWGKLALGRWYSATLGVKQGHVLVTWGPFARTRHPIYAGVLTVLLGAGLAWNSVLTVLLFAAMCAPLYLHTLVEEQLLEQHFGEAWRAYKARVPRLLPALRSGRPLEDARAG